MKGLLIFLFFCFVSLLIYMALSLIIRKKQSVADRVHYYLDGAEPEEEQPIKPSIKINMMNQLQKATGNIMKKLLSREKNQKLEQSLRSAGVPIRPEEFILFQWISIALGSGVMYLLSGSLLLALFGAIAGFLLPKLFISRKQRTRLRKFNDDLPDMITSIIGGLRAGFSFPQALKNVADEAQSPLKEEIEITLKEMQYGSTLEEALNGLKERMPSDDLDLMIQAIVIQRQVGGNLATVLETIISTIRERMRIQRDIKTLTAQGRLSGMVIGFMPLILGILLYLIEPDYIGSLFTHPVGIALIIGGAISSIIGFFMIRKIISIEV
ncbi:type II secretion system F family protein [Lederbergia citri]|uniref:Type II secretion system F family protein n=1 Tax=Lederbergia citri TaxID=2833580 RepID=A0A942YIS6_9BACI|nr:type II secretion system F family protein [Lederbergia citri]MBS4197912.1 type II secretion system F family protein [Lederbergia citri]